MTKFVLDRKESYMPPRTVPIFVIDDGMGTKEFRGKVPEFYYYFSVDLDNLYFYKSPTTSKKHAVPMNRSEIKHVLREITPHLNPGNVAIINILQYHCQKMWEEEDKEAVSARKSGNTQPTVRRNNEREIQRKAAQRDKLLNKYSTIAPVVVLDAQKQPTAVCAKIDNTIYYMSLNEEKPAFWILSITGARPMRLSEVGELIGFVGESEKAAKLCENIAPLYQKFMKMNISRISSDYAGTLFAQSRTALAKGLMSFSPIERSFCRLVSERAQPTR